MKFSRFVCSGRKRSNKNRYDGSKFLVDRKSGTHLLFTTMSKVKPDIATPFSPNVHVYHCILRVNCFQMFLTFAETVFKKMPMKVMGR